MNSNDETDRTNDATAAAASSPPSSAVAVATAVAVPAPEMTDQQAIAEIMKKKNASADAGGGEVEFVPQPSPELKASFINKLFFCQNKNNTNSDEESGRSGPILARYTLTLFRCCCVCLGWMNPLVATGARRPLETTDMYEVKPDVDAKYCSELFDKEWAVELRLQRESRERGDEIRYEPRIERAMYRIFKYEIWAGACIKLVMDGLQFFQPILLEWLLAYSRKVSTHADDPSIDAPPQWEGYVYAVAIGLNPAITAILSSAYFSTMMKIGLRMRTMLVTQLYKKSLRLAPAARQQMSVGQIVVMMSTDASKVDFFMGYFHYLWSGVEQCTIAIILLLRAIGLPALVGIGVVLLLIPIQAAVMRKLQALRRLTVKYTDARVKLMNEILQGIRVLKLYAWEGSFLQKLSSIRTQEMHYVRASSYVRAYNSSLVQVGPILMAVLSFVTVGLTSDNFKPEFIFSSLVLFNLLRMPLILFPLTLSWFTDARVGMQRINGFMMAEELASQPTLTDGKTEGEGKEYAIKVQHAQLAWEKVQTQETAAASKKQDKKTIAANAEEKKQEDLTAVLPFHLDDVNLTIPRGSLTVIVGSVGSGKSSLLSGILGEMKRSAGEVLISGSVGFCPQQAWIQNTTLKANILFGLPFDKQRYEHAIKYSALASDIAVLPAQDATEIGEKGINLSGGQKQRVNLARALYFDADIIMLDDPLSAVDSATSKYLFNECICHALRNKTRVLVTHQLQYVSACDQVLFLENGKITEQGTYQQLMADKKNFFTLMSTYVGEEEEKSTDESDDASSPVDPSARGLKSARRLISRGSSAAKPSAAVEALSAEAKVKKLTEQKAAASLMQTEERTKGGVPLSAYSFYFKHCGGLFILSVALLFLFLQTATASWTTWWLGLWSSKHYDQSTTFYLSIYAALGVSQCLFGLIAILTMTRMGIIAALELHQLSFEGVLRAPMAFFDTTPIGRIISRFSKDQDVIDSQLMEALRSIINTTLTVLSTFVMICIVTPWFLVPLAPILVVYYFVQQSYRETSRELKRIESISRSPLFAHFSETLTGLATIRAYRAQETFERGNEARMNGNNRSYYLQVLTQRWLAIRVETIGACITFFAALIIVIQGNGLNAGQAGVSLTYAISVTSVLNWIVRQAVDAENAMNSVERSKFYVDQIPQERPSVIPEADQKLEKTHWPATGAVKFENVKIKYRENLPFVLHGVDIDIKGGERVGIIGRTGAGKSSLMVALFRLVEVSSGKISIDGVDISAIGLRELRSKLAIIPQDPVLYSGTVRSNLDPFNSYSDEQLWNVLDKAQLRDTVMNLSKKLEDPVSENGENFSVGQRCQICLARAMLREAKVLIMDEATASVDMATDALIQRSLRNDFQCTLLTIAHRLNTIVDYDRVLVLDFGVVKEFDTPANLLRDPSSIFSSMVNETGETNANLLRTIAFNAEKGIKFDATQILGLTQVDSTVAATSPASPHPLSTTSPSSSSSSSFVDPAHVRWHIESEESQQRREEEEGQTTHSQPD